MRILAIVIGVTVFVLDFLTKWWVTRAPEFRVSTVVIDNFFNLHYVENQGIAFGYFHEFESEWKAVILSVMAIVALAIVLYYIVVSPLNQKLLFVSLGLLLGGILGNFTDRLLHGYVVDFLELHWKSRFFWPTFNIADAAITCGVLIILYETFFGFDPQKSGEREETVIAE
ncbi:MAG: signal peptidase II [Acidobacteriota bacterium]